MPNVRYLLLGHLSAALFAITSVAQGNLSDPYEILNRHFAACGGLDRMKAEQTLHMEGTLSVAGLEGTLRVWNQRPDRTRVDVDLGILKISQGDNGEYQWVLDANGKLQKITNPDQATVDRRELSRRMAEYEYADPQSEVFTVTFEGIEKVDEQDCYVIKVENSINRDVYSSYINVDNFFLEKTTSLAAEQSNDTFYDDYREVDGLMVAFQTRQTLHQTGQTEEVTVAKYVSNPGIDPSIFESPGEAGRDYRFLQGHSAENIPFRFLGNHLYIPVVVGCKEKYWILDTGAAMSVISDRFAAELGLEMQGDVKGRGAGGTVDIKLTTLPSFSLQGVEFDEQTVAVIDMSELNRLLSLEIAGILGYDFLSRFVTRIDYANEQLSLFDPDSFVYSGDGYPVDVHIRNSVFMVQATLDGEHSGIWLFDMGASTTSLDGAYALRNGFTEKKGIEGIARGAANAFKTKAVKCRSLELAGFTIDEPKVSFSYGGTDTTLTADEIGILGNSFFRNFVIYCDYVHEQVIMEKGADFNQEFPEDHSGLQLTRADGGHIEVLFVASGTPAAKAGFQEGDVVKSINGVDVEHLDGLVGIRGVLKEEPGIKYTVRVDRNGQEKELKLTLADLF